MERLTALDLMSIWPEKRGWSNDVGALAILDGTRLLDPDGRLRIETMRDHVEARLHLVPRFRQLLYRPQLGFGWPLWVDAPHIDLTEHVEHLPLDAPADETRLLLACEQLRSRRLSFVRPLWRMTFLSGLADSHVALVMKVHHSIADGMSGIAALGAFVDAVPDPAEVAAPPWIPRPRPTARELFQDNMRRAFAKVDHAAETIAHPSEAIGKLRQGLPALRETFAEERPRRTSLNARAIGWHRRFALLRSDLEGAKRVARQHGAKVNDVLMTALAAGLRDVLMHRGERVDGLVLRAAVPVSLHDQSGAPQGNQDGMMVVPLPVGVADDVHRLHLIAAETRERKRKARPQGGVLFRNGVIQRAFLGLMARQRFMNTYAANVPGPPVPLYFAGAPLLELFPIVPISGNVSVGIGALSYAGQLNVTAVADRDLVPDLDDFIDGMGGSLQTLGHANLVATG